MSINLKEMADKSYEAVWLDGTVLKLKSPTRAMLLEMIDMKNAPEISDETAMNKVYDLVFRVLSRGEPVKKGRKRLFSRFIKRNFQITKDEVEALPLDVAFALFDGYFSHYYGELGKS